MEIDSKKKYLFVFDIETIPDYSVAYNLLNIAPESNHSDAELGAALTEYHLKITDGKNPFLRQPFHKIVAISYLYAEIKHERHKEHYVLKKLTSAGKVPYTEDSEKELLSGFFRMIEDYNQPKLVTFNGKTFDIPVIKYRAMKHGINGSLYYHGTTFDNYDYKYNKQKHCDLLDALSDFSSSARVKLNEVCAIFGLPGKIGTDGGDVERLFNENKLQEIRDYCETDVLNTYLVYLRYALHTDKLTADSYNTAIRDVLNLISGSDKAALNNFKQQWFISHKNTYGDSGDTLDNFAPFVASNYKIQD